jgi:hypothetical protein
MLEELVPHPGGRPPKITDPDRLKAIMDVKITEQLSWPAMAEWYEEEYGESINHKTLRQSVLRDAPTLLVHDRVSKQVRHAVENIWDQVDILRLIMYAFNGKFTEWSLYHERCLSAHINDNVRFTSEDKLRMDALWADLVAFFMRALTLMRELKTLDIPVPEFEMLIRANANVAGEMTREAASAEGELSPGGIRQLIEAVGTQTRIMLDGVHAKHREEGRGYYRRIPEPEEDDYNLMEVDDSGS